MPSNVQSVISDIGDVQDDLHDEMRNKVGAAVRILKQDVVSNITADADWRGPLRNSVSFDRVDNGGEIQFEVSVGGQKAKYAKFVEYGTGERSDKIWVGSKLPGSLSKRPPDYPYDAPDLSEGLQASIVEWVKTKPVIPRTNISEEALGYIIAETIAEKGTFAHPFLRPAWAINEIRIRSAARQALHEAVN